jgi:transcriptional regulator with XRE-family HTH domain
LHVAQRFERFLEIYRHPDGSKWTGAQLAKATGSMVPRSYVTNLRKGRIVNPGYEKMRAIVKAMGFAPEVWFEEGLGSEGRTLVGPEGSSIAGRLGRLFETIKNPKTGEPYTSAEVAPMSAGVLTEESVEGDQNREDHRSLGRSGSGLSSGFRRAALLLAGPGQAALGPR